MATPFNLLGTLLLPGTPGLSPEPLPFGMASAYDAKAEFELVLPDAVGTKVVDFTAIPTAGAKLLLLLFTGTPPVSGGEPPPIAVTLNAAAAHEITSGGCICLGSPKPVAGLIALSIAYTAAGKVRIWLLG